MESKYTKEETSALIRLVKRVLDSERRGRLSLFHDECGKDTQQGREISFNHFKYYYLNFEGFGGYDERKVSGVNKHGNYALLHPSPYHDSFFQEDDEKVGQDSYRLLDTKERLEEAGIQSVLVHDIENIHNGYKNWTCLLIDMDQPDLAENVTKLMRGSEPYLKYCTDVGLFPINPLNDTVVDRDVAIKAAAKKIKYKRFDVCRAEDDLREVHQTAKRYGVLNAAYIELERARKEAEADKGRG